VHAAAAVFMTDDARAARRLLGEKQIFRDLEARATEARFARIRAGRVESVETSALHLDVLRLKRINSHVAAAAYPVLAGDNAVLFVDQHRVGEAKFHRERDGATPRVN
jgi:phosphate:Na+ symporter